MHYQRWWKHGDPLWSAAVHTACRVEGCGGVPRSTHAELCEMHYGRQRRGVSLAGPPVLTVLPEPIACRQCGTLTCRPGGLCSARCQSRGQHGLPPTLPCASCGQAFVPFRRWKVCSYACHLERESRAQALRRLKRAGYRPADPDFFTRPQVYRRDGWICQLCYEPIDPELKWPDPGSVTLDHVVPIADGGAHTLENVQAAHASCNCAKGGGKTAAKQAS